jgi:hypothetical protein
VTGYEVLATEIKFEVVPADGERWPVIGPDPLATSGPARCGLRPDGMAISASVERPAVMIAVHGRNVRRDGSTGARSTRVYLVGSRFPHDAPPGWVRQITADLVQRVEDLRVASRPARP